jgi:hypothetical protein
VLSGPASFSHSGFPNQFGVLNIAKAAVSPSSVTEFKRLKSTFVQQHRCSLGNNP